MYEKVPFLQAQYFKGQYYQSVTNAQEKGEK